MAKRKPLFGVNNYHKKTPKRRPGRHAKKMSKRKPPRKRIGAKGVSHGKSYCNNVIIFNVEWRN